jgi:anti-anti-sigma factor
MEISDSEAFLKTEELPGGITLVHLIGRMDTIGAAALDLKMRAIADVHRAVVINLTQVDFLASMGIRMLVLSAQTIASKGGRVACFGANENVTRVLETSGVASLLPILGGLEMATASVTL